MNASVHNASDAQPWTATGGTLLMLTIATTFSSTRSHRPSVRGMATGGAFILRPLPRPAAPPASSGLRVRGRVPYRHRLDRAADDVEALAEHVFGDDKRRQQPDAVAVQAGAHHDDALRDRLPHDLERLVRRGRFLRFAVADKLH